MTTAPVRPDWVDPALYPFTDRWLEHDGSVIHYVDEGPRSGPTLLMTHSNPTWSFLYRDVIATLRDFARCVAIDYPGFGLSRAAASYGFTLREHATMVQALADELDLREVVLVAHDWGGPIGVGAFLDMPERIRGLVLGNSKLWADRSLTARAFGAALSRGIGRRLILERNAYVKKLMPAAFASRRLTVAEHAHYLAPFPTPASRLPVVISPREITAGADFLDEVSGILPALRNAPALVLWAGKDRATRRGDLERLLRELPRAVVTELPDVGHYLWEETPHRCAEAIRDFLVIELVDTTGRAEPAEDAVRDDR